MPCLVDVELRNNTKYGTSRCVKPWRKFVLTNMSQKYKYVYTWKFWPRCKKYSQAEVVPLKTIEISLIRTFSTEFEYMKQKVSYGYV